MFPHRWYTERTQDARGGPAATLVQDQPVVSRPHQGPIFWSCPPPGSAPGRSPALPTLGCTLITSPKGKPFVWKEMVPKEAAAALKTGPGPAPGRGALAEGSEAFSGRGAPAPLGPGGASKSFGFLTSFFFLSPVLNHRGHDWPLSPSPVKWAWEEDHKAAEGSSGLTPNTGLALCPCVLLYSGIFLSPSHQVA